MGTNHEEARQKLAIVIAATIFVAWTLAIARDFIDSSYDVPPPLTGLMTTTVGFCFIDSTIRSIKKSRGNDQDESASDSIHN